jgi:hypothetical protein
VIQAFGRIFSNEQPNAVFWRYKCRRQIWSPMTYLFYCSILGLLWVWLCLQDNILAICLTLMDSNSEYSIVGRMFSLLTFEFFFTCYWFIFITPLGSANLNCFRARQSVIILSKGFWTNTVSVYSLCTYSLVSFSSKYDAIADNFMVNHSITFDRVKNKITWIQVPCKSFDAYSRLFGTLLNPHCSPVHTHRIWHCTSKIVEKKWDE